MRKGKMKLVLSVFLFFLFVNNVLAMTKQEVWEKIKNKKQELFAEDSFFIPITCVGKTAGVSSLAQCLAVFMQINKKYYYDYYVINKAILFQSTDKNYKNEIVKKVNALVSDYTDYHKNSLQKVDMKNTYGQIISIKFNNLLKYKNFFASFGGFSKLSDFAGNLKKMYKANFFDIEIDELSNCSIEDICDMLTFKQPILINKKGNWFTLFGFFKSKSKVYFLAYNPETVEMKKVRLQDAFPFSIYIKHGDKFYNNSKTIFSEECYVKKELEQLPEFIELFEYQNGTKVDFKIYSITQEIANKNIEQEIDEIFLKNLEEIK